MRPDPVGPLPPLRPASAPRGWLPTLALLGCGAFAASCGPAAGPPQVPTLHLATSRLPTARTGSPYEVELEARGPKTPLRWRLVGGRLPEGLRLDAEAGLLQGWPRLPGAHRFTLEVREGEDREALRDVTFAADRRALDLLVERGGVDLIPEPLPPAGFGQPYAHRTQASGGTPPYRFEVSSAPAVEGLVLDPSGRWHGRPRAPTGTYTLAVRVTEAGGGAAERAFELRLVVAPLVIATPLLPDAARDVAYEALLTLRPAGGGPPFAWSLLTSPEARPEGLDFDEATGRLHGRPLVAGEFPLEFEVTDGAGQVARRLLTLHVHPGPVLHAVAPAFHRGDGLPLRLDGENFQPGMTAAFGGAPARPALLESAERAWIDPPLALGSSGLVGVTLRNPDGGTHVLAGAYRFPLAEVAFEDVGVQGTALSSARGLAAGDLDGDGRDDLVHVGSTGIETIHPPSPLGASEPGALSPAGWRTVSVRTSGSYNDVGLADLDADGDLDLVALRSGGTETIETYLNDGAGGFPATATWSQSYPKPSPHAPFALALGEVDGDGLPDLAFTSGSGNQAWGYVYRGLGDGSFALLHLARGTIWDDSGGCFAPNAVALGDLDEDGRDDFVVTDAFPTACAPGSSCPTTDGVDGQHPGRREVVAWVALADERGEPGAWRPVALASGEGFLDGDNTGLALYDHDGDGHLDLVVAGGFRDVRGTGLAFLAGDGRGNFAERGVRVTAVNRRFVARVDANQDGFDDLVVVGGDGRAGSFAALGVSMAEVYLGGLGSWTRLGWHVGGDASEGLQGANPGRVVRGDFDGDGREDFAVDQSFHAKERFANDQDDGWVEGVRVFLNRSR